MRRFIAIVVVLIALALLVNYFFNVPEPELDPGIEVPELVIEEDVAEPIAKSPPAGPASAAPSFEAPPEPAEPADAEATSPATSEETGRLPK